MNRFLRPLLVVALVGCTATPPSDDRPAPSGPVLSWIADDYPAALAEARARQLPLFVESWAPW